MKCTTDKYNNKIPNKMSSQHKGSLDDLILPNCAFPHEVFPEEIGNIIHKISTAQNVGFELIASSALALVGGALGNSIRISPKSTYEVAPFIWLIIIGETGSGKTPAIMVPLKHIIGLQASAFDIYEEEKSRYEEQQQQVKRDENEESLDKPKLKQLLMSDFTIEALANAFDDDSRGVIVYKDELSGLVKGLDQYRGKGNDRQHYLELFNCGVWKVDRKTGVKFIKNTGATIIGGIQPVTMPKIFAEDFFDDGFLPRFLLLNEEERKMEFSRVAVSNEDLLPWTRLIDWCYDRPITIDDKGFIKPQVLIFSAAAFELWEEHYNGFGVIKPLLSLRMRPFVPKLAGYYSLKFAGILHCIRSFTEGRSIGSVIDVETTVNAIALTNYFAAQTMEALRLYRTSEEEFTGPEKALLQTIQELQAEVINGKLSLKRIREMLNAGLPEARRLSHHSNKRLGGMLRDLGLNPEKSNGGVYYLIWQEDKIQSLLSRYKSTLSTTSTKPVSNNTAKVDKVDKVDHRSDTNTEVIDLEHGEMEVIE